MKSFPKNGLRAAAVLAVAVTVPVGPWAGEAINFSNARSHPDPNQKPALPGASARTGFNLGPQGPIEHLSPSLYQSRRRNPREERKAQNAEDEKKNWMVLDPGQLDAEDDEKAGFGVKNYDLEKKTVKRDYFFAPPEEKSEKSGSRPQLGSGRLAGKNRNLPDESSKESSRNSDQGESDGKGTQATTKDGRPVGDHVSKDLDMKDLLAPGKANSVAPAEDKTTKLWRDIFGGGATRESRADGPDQREVGSVPDGFRPSASESFRPQGSSPSLGFRNDFNARPPAAASPGPSGSASTGFRPPAVPLTPRVPDPYLGRPAPPATAGRVPTPNDSYGGRQNGIVPGPAGSSYGQPPPRRPSSGFEIPARPGYGGR